MLDENKIKIEAPFIHWDKNLEIGVQHIDLQHKSIINKINEVYIQCGRKNGLKEVVSTLIFLEKYTVTHFKDEEALQIECNFPDFERHKASHEQFIQRSEELLDKFYKEGVSFDMLMSVINFMSDWIQIHIKKDDIEFAQFYKKFKENAD